MKVIDLLNKIANGEEAPRTIRIGTFNFIFNSYSCIDLYYKEEESCFNWLEFMSITLDDEVEILDEEDEFIDIEEITSAYTPISQELKGELGGVVAIYNSVIYELKDKINTLIKNQKKIIDKLKEE